MLVLDAVLSPADDPDALAAGTDYAQLHLVTQLGVDVQLSLSASPAAAALQLPGCACLCPAVR